MLTRLERFSVFRVMVKSLLLSLKMLAGENKNSSEISAVLGSRCFLPTQKLIPITTNTLISLAGFPQWQLYVSISNLLHNQCPAVLLKFVGKPLKSKL